MGTLTESPARAGSVGAPQALFAEARQRRRRRWLAGIAAVLLASGAVAAVTLPWPHWASGQAADRADAVGPAGASDSSAAAAVWYDGGRLRFGDIYPSGRVTQRAGPKVSAEPLPLVAAGGRVYWVNTMSEVPSVQYLDLATGKTGAAGWGLTAFLSANGRYLLMAQTATTLAEMPVAGGDLRELALPPGWYLPGGDGTAQLDYEGLATANGVVVESHHGRAWRPQVLGLWNPGSRTVTVLGRGLAVIGAYTPPGARYSLLAWLPSVCRFPDNCLLKITNTATLGTRTIRSPLPGGFAVGGAISPDGTQLAVFPQIPSKGLVAGYARLALVDLRTGAMRMVPRPRIRLGQDISWALWLPDGRHLIVAGSDLVDAVTLSAKPLLPARGHGHEIANGQNVNFTATILPPKR